MTTRMSTKGQIVIPRAARELLGVTDGTKFSIRIEGDGYKLVPQQSGRHGLDGLFSLAQTIGKKYGIAAMSQKALDQSIMDSVTELDTRTKTKSHAKNPNRK